MPETPPKSPSTRRGWRKLVSEHKAATIIPTVVVLALGGVELTGVLRDGTEPVPRDSCTSPWATTPPYVDPGEPQWLVNAGLSGGLVLRAHVPPGAIGVRIGFKEPGVGAGWQVSGLVPADKDGLATAKVGVGGGWVVFGAQTVGPPGSDTCNNAPPLSAQQLDAGSYLFAPGSDPWPNAANDFTHALRR